MRAILGRKAGMTQVFTKDGKAIAVSVVETTNNKVTQVKTVEKDGYNSLQLSFGERDAKRANKPDLGHVKKANASPHYFIKEIRDMDGYNVGDTINAENLFKAGDIIDVIGTSKGKGFQGSIKRHNYSRGPMSHGSKYHRGSGSMGDIKSKVKTSKKLPGHMGHEQVTTQNLQIVKVDNRNNSILIKGSIPGPNKGFVIIKDSKVYPNRNVAIEMIDINEEQKKLELLELGKKVNAKLSTSMNIAEMQQELEEATKKHELEVQARDQLHEEAKELGVDIKGKSEEQIKEMVEKAKTKAELQKNRDEKEELPNQENKEDDK